MIKSQRIKASVLTEDTSNDKRNERRPFLKKLALGLVGAGALLALKDVPKASAVTLGDVAFSDGATGVLFDHTNLFWDNTGKKLGLGTNTPLYLCDVRTPGSTTAQMHISSTNTDAGGYLSSGNDTNFFMSGGAAYSGSGTSWIAKATSAYLFGGGVAGVRFYHDTGLTPGSLFVPTARIMVAPGGNVGIGTETPTRKLDVAGDVGQTLVGNGLVKAAVIVDGGAVSVVRSFNNLPGGTTPTVTQPSGPGTYAIDFGANVSQRFFQATLINSNASIPNGAADGQILVSPRDGNVNQFYARTNDTTGTNTNRSFCLLVF